MNVFMHERKVTDGIYTYVHTYIHAYIHAYMHTYMHDSKKFSILKKGIGIEGEKITETS